MVGTVGSAAEGTVLDEDVESVGVEGVEGVGSTAGAGAVVADSSVFV